MFAAFVFVFSHPPEERERLMFLPSTFLFFLGLCRKLADTLVQLVFAELRDEEPYGAPTGGCRANNVR